MQEELSGGRKRKPFRGVTGIAGKADAQKPAAAD